jgi:hypothetical protein
MVHSEFHEQFQRIKLQFGGDKVFSAEREKMFWLRYGRYSAAAFEKAVDWVILHSPMPSQIVTNLDAQLATVAHDTLGTGTFGVDIPDNPRAKELANLYAPQIIANMRAVKARLPYNPDARGELPENDPPPIDRSGEWA